MHKLFARLRAAWWVASGADRAVVYRAVIRGTVEADPPAYFGAVQLSDAERRVVDGVLSPARRTRAKG
jgi:hypothetical protein